MAVKKKDVERIVEAIGGKDNIQYATHCVTRLRLVLKDESKVDADLLAENNLVKGQFEADDQYQIVIGPGTVDEVYAQFAEQTGISDDSGKSSDTQSGEKEEKKGNALQRFIKLLGDIFIPILPAIVTAGLLLGINNLLTMKDLFGPQPLVEQFPQLHDIADIIKVIANTAFTFLPALVGWSSMRVFGGSPILGLVLGLILMNPQLVPQSEIAKGDIPTWNIFGLEIKQLNYQNQVLPILLATYVLAKLEKLLNRVVHDTIKMLVVGPVALLITGFLSFILIGPIALWLGAGITNAVVFIFDYAGWLGGALYGFFYAPLVITGLHHMFLAVDFQLMSSDLKGTYLWPILAISNICQGSAVFGAWYVYKRNKMVKEEGLALTSGISGLLGVTEPALFGVNLPLKYPFLAAISTSGVLGAIVGASGVLGKVGVGGVPAIISIKSEYWGLYLVVTLIAVVVPAALTIIFSNFSHDKVKKMVDE